MNTKSFWPNTTKTPSSRVWRAALKGLLFGLLFFYHVPYGAARDSIKIVAYNVENLFDTIPAQEYNDQEFSPGGVKHWNKQRYYTKVRKIARVLTDIGQWSYPDLIGLCEIEGDSVVRHLSRAPGLRGGSYEYAVSSGRDARGIEVALLWNSRQFALISHKEIPTYITGSLPPWYAPTDTLACHTQGYAGRNVLWVTLARYSDHTRWHVFVVHAPSRRNGIKQTNPNRIQLCQRVRSATDSIRANTPNDYIVIMGDFNDNPNSPSLLTGLQATLLQHYNSSSPPVLINISPLPTATQGSHLFRGRYWMPDQIILSHHFFRNRIPEQYPKLHIFTPKYLWEPSARLRKRPKRTYRGNFYSSGYSDHFPVYTTLYL